MMVKHSFDPSEEWTFAERLRAAAAISRANKRADTLKRKMGDPVPAINRALDSLHSRRDATDKAISELKKAQFCLDKIYTRVARQEDSMADERLLRRCLTYIQHRGKRRCKKMKWGGPCTCGRDKLVQEILAKLEQTEGEMTDDKKTTSTGKGTKPQAPPPEPKGGRVADGGGVVKK